MSRVEDLLNVAKTNEMLEEILTMKKAEEKKKKAIMWVLITIGAILAVVGIAYAVYCFFTPDYLEDFEEDFEEEDGFLEEDEEEEAEEDEENQEDEEA